MLCFQLRRLTQLSSDIISAALNAGCEVVVLTNSPTLPLPESVAEVVVLSLEGLGDLIDSYTSAARIANTLAAAVAEARRDQLLTRFNSLEETWRRLHLHRVARSHTRSGPRAELSAREPPYPRDPAAHIFRHA